jgi:phosphatidylinositol kinase/protein kinase (PI-3  family)
LLGIGDRHLDNLLLTPQGMHIGKSAASVAAPLWDALSLALKKDDVHRFFVSSGNLFHIDFGYILGRDPKPFPPPMKLCKEMVDAMGGTGSIHYGKFKSLCYTAFIILRKSANLILNLFALMVEANVPDIKIEPDKSVAKV